ncbi:hypothetical protein Fuma_00210 [Fuerstiella marisgermanici]|uniref:Uncharacterized protein n=1 Tax=Fuerstiella marisgermanici TaxID=1891926 RepID=A0A1P8W9B4_9PLAN|nr:hypothetical protein Fuma_00210 [Fuerstiella marisgermanici]
MSVLMVTRSVSEGSSCDESLAYASGYPKHGPMTKGGAIQLIKRTEGLMTCADGLAVTIDAISYYRIPHDKDICPANAANALGTRQSADFAESASPETPNVNCNYSCNLLRVNYSSDDAAVLGRR